MSRNKEWITWRKLNTVKTTYVSTYPAQVWKITRVKAPAGGLSGWAVSRAAHDGDEYQELARVTRLADAKAYANNWMPEEVS
jgi:hypothetical protein